jgi:KDO2-lipid IV(A) lauroyltransferase
MLNYFLYRMGEAIATALPLPVVYKIAVFLGDIYYAFAYLDRRAVKENLRVIFPEKSEKEIKGIRLRMSRNFAKYLADFFRFGKINQQYLNKYVRLENIHYYDAALKQQKGAVVLSAHIGNWELGGVISALLGYPFWAVALTHKNKKVNDFFNNQRENKGMKVIPLGKAARVCLNVLRRNEIVALVGDRDFSQSGSVLDFFGKPTYFPEGPAVFSLRTGAPIVPAFTLRNPDDTFTLKIEKPLEFSPTGDKQQDICNLMLFYIKIFEDYIRQYPEQWFMFRRFWIT